MIADAVTAQQVGARVNGRQVAVKYLPWLGLGEQNFSEGDDRNGGALELHDA